MKLALLLFLDVRGVEQERRFTIGLLLALAFLGAVGSALTVFLIGLILAFLLDPIVTWLAARRVPRGLATLITMVVFFVVIGLLVVAFLDVVVSQAGRPSWRRCPRRSPTSRRGS